MKIITRVGISVTSCAFELTGADSKPSASLAVYGGGSACEAAARTDAAAGGDAFSGSRSGGGAPNAGAPRCASAPLARRDDALPTASPPLPLEAAAAGVAFCGTAPRRPAPPRARESVRALGGWREGGAAYDGISSSSSSRSSAASSAASSSSSDARACFGRACFGRACFGRRGTRAEE